MALMKVFKLRSLGFIPNVLEALRSCANLISLTNFCIMTSALVLTLRPSLILEITVLEISRLFMTKTETTVKIAAYTINSAMLTPFFKIIIRKFGQVENF